MSVNQQNGQLFFNFSKQSAQISGVLFDHLVKPFIQSSIIPNLNNNNGEPLSDIDLEFTNPPWLPPFHCLQVQPINKFIF